MEMGTHIKNGSNVDMMFDLFSYPRPSRKVCILSKNRRLSLKLLPGALESHFLLTSMNKLNIMESTVYEYSIF